MGLIFICNFASLIVIQKVASMKHPLLIVLTLTLFMGCNNSEKKATTSMDNKEEKSACSSGCCKASNQSSELACKLTTPELQQRKETVLASLKQQITEKKELTNGYAFKFPGTDKMLDELLEFIKTERECCSFFVFNLSISGDKKEVWLELTGADGTKDIIVSELGLWP